MIIFSKCTNFSKQAVPETGSAEFLKLMLVTGVIVLFILFKLLINIDSSAMTIKKPEKSINQQILLSKYSDPEVAETKSPDIKLKKETGNFHFISFPKVTNTINQKPELDKRLNHQNNELNTLNDLPQNTTQSKNYFIALKKKSIDKIDLRRFLSQFVETDDLKIIISLLDQIKKNKFTNSDKKYFSDKKFKDFTFDKVSHKNDLIRKTALISACETYPMDQRCLNALQSFLRDPKPSIQKVGLIYSAKIGYGHVGLLKDLVPFLGHKQLSSRIFAKDAISSMGKTSAAYLIGYYHNLDWESVSLPDEKLVDIRIIGRLYKYYPEKSKALLIKILNYRDLMDIKLVLIQFRAIIHKDKSIYGQLKEFLDKEKNELNIQVMMDFLLIQKPKKELLNEFLLLGIQRGNLQTVRKINLCINKEHSSLSPQAVKILAARIIENVNKNYLFLIELKQFPEASKNYLPELYKTITKLNNPNQLKQAHKWLEAIKESK